MRFDQYMICMLQVTETLPTPEPNSRLCRSRPQAINCFPGGLIFYHFASANARLFYSG